MLTLCEKVHPLVHQNYQHAWHLYYVLFAERIFGAQSSPNTKKRDVVAGVRGEARQLKAAARDQSAVLPYDEAVPHHREVFKAAQRAAASDGGVEKAIVAIAKSLSSVATALNDSQWSLFSLDAGGHLCYSQGRGGANHRVSISLPDPAKSPLKVSRPKTVA